MVKQTRHIFDLSDILALRMQCHRCGQETVQTVEAAKVLTACPLCHDEWETVPSSGIRSDNWQLVQAIRGILREAANNPPAPMTIRFEIDGETEDEGG